MSFQTFLDNRIPFSAEKFVLPDQEGQEVLLVVVVAAFEAERPGGPLQLAEEQSPVRPVDEHYGDPARSSVQYESDLALEKSFVDLLLNAHAYAPGGVPTERVPVEIQVADIRKFLLVQGDREWASGVLGKHPSRPALFLKMPIRYERAFGGMDTSARDPEKHRAEPRNPVGVGFRGAPSQTPDIATQVPNVEYPHDCIKSHRDRTAPAGLGVISRSWKPRLDFAGTYDEAWLNGQWPLLPIDFDPRHNQAAPVDQQSKTLRGGEIVQLRNLTPEGAWRFKLPALDIPVHLLYKDRLSRAALRMDTVLIEPDRYRVTLTSRLKMRLPRNQGILREIVLGHMQPGWLQARVTGKEYIDQRDTDGVDPNGRSFQL